MKIYLLYQLDGNSSSRGMSSSLGSISFSCSSGSEKKLVKDSSAAEHKTCEDGFSVSEKLSVRKLVNPKTIRSLCTFGPCSAYCEWASEQRGLRGTFRPWLTRKWVFIRSPCGFVQDLVTTHAVENL